MGGLLSRGDEPQWRTISTLRAGYTPSKEQLRFADNSICTSKYNVVTFLPRSLFEQFRRVANIYFLLISVLMILGTYTTLFSSPLTPYSTLGPLIAVLVITMAKEGIEDVKRHQSDRRVNNGKALVLNLDNTGEFDSIPWKDVRVGSIVKVADRDEIPADLVLLTSSEANGVAYTETSNIDGETNLKIRSSAPTRDGAPPGPEWAEAQDLHDLEMSIEYERPNPRIHFFSGTLKFQERSVAVDQSNVLLRGSSLRNTKWALGLVVYTGSETKIMQNARAAPSKQSNVDKVTNKIMAIIFAAMALVTTVSLIGYVIFVETMGGKLYYVCVNYSGSPVELFRENCIDESTSGKWGYWFTFLILFNNFIPISLYVTLELVNAIQASFIDNDLEMYDEPSDVPALARTSNMNADLGQIEYIFSDKTGTLTQNLMTFKRCSLGGAIYGEITQEEKEQMTELQRSRVRDAPPLSKLKEKVEASDPGTPEVDFALCLALNHTVVIEKDSETGKKSLQAESPDEEALVAGAKMLGVEFVDRTPGEVVVMFKGKQMRWQLLVTIPFDSSRKRMTVIVRNPDGKYILLCKGADNIILERAKSYMNTTKDVINEHLGVFANDGLRTLLLAKRELSAQEYEAWYKKYHTASTATEGRADKIAEVAVEVERDLSVIGATAIEDKLQDDVANTIADLGKAGIKLWVLTGDKMETAINIGYSCRLLDPDMTLIKLKEKDGDPGSVERQLRSLMQHFSRLIEDQSLFNELWGKLKTTIKEITPGIKSPSSQPNVHLPEPLLERPSGAPPLNELTSDALALVVDGPSLTHVLGVPELEQLFLKIACICKSVVACRVSPAQKRLIVKLVKKGLPHRPITLAIGDGANDVGMIQEAQVGVGISGKEGRQAVNNADFAIAQFRFLRRLLLVHGHWDYRRLCKVILYSFYKNIVLTFILFYYCFYCGFSGQSLYESMVYSGFNWFLAMPILCTGLFDKDVDAETAIACQKLYVVGRTNTDLNMKVISKWMFQALLDSVLIFFLPMAAYHEPRAIWSERGYEDGIYVFGTTVYSALILAMLYKAINMTWTWNFWSFFWLGFSLLFYFCFLLAYSCALDWAFDFYDLAFQMFDRPTFWIVLIQVPLLCWCTDLFFKWLHHEFNPKVGDHAIEFDRGYTTDKGLDLLSTIKDHSERGEEERNAEVVPRRDLASNKYNLTRGTLRALNRNITEAKLNELGIVEGDATKVRSSFAYDHVSSEYGPGASLSMEELQSIYNEEGPAGVHRRQHSLRRASSEDGGSFEEKDMV